MRVVVFGAGAIGTLFGARLAEAGHSVILVARPEHAAAVRRAGITVEGLRPAAVQVKAVDRLEPGHGAEVALLTVKTFDLEEAGRLFAEASRMPLPVLAPQNGLGIEAGLARGLRAGGWPEPEPVIVRVVHSVPATLLGPGRVRQAGEGEILLPAETTHDPRALERAAELLGSMGYPLRRVPAFEREVWRKALLNAAINPVTADHGIVNGELARDPWRGQALDLLHEARRVAAAEGMDFPAVELESDLWRVVRATAANHSSMLQDLERGRRTEVDQISGELLRRGAEHGLELPSTKRVVARIHRRERRDPPERDERPPAPQPSSEGRHPRAP